MSKNISIIIEKDKDGYYAYAPELKGCQSQGDTLDETLENIKEAIELYVETMNKDEIELLNKEIITSSYEVKVA